MLQPSITCRSEETRAAIGASLNMRVADLTDMTCAVNTAHWNVFGAPNFVQLHELFDRLNGEIRTTLDKLAERARVLGVTVTGTLQAAARSTSLPAYPDVTTFDEHVREVAMRLAIVLGRLRATSTLCLKVDEQVTANVIFERAAELEIVGWFLLATLPDGGKAAMATAQATLAPREAAASGRG